MIEWLIDWLIDWLIESYHRWAVHIHFFLLCTRLLNSESGFLRSVWGDSNSFTVPLSRTITLSYFNIVEIRCWKWTKKHRYTKIKPYWQHHHKPWFKIRKQNSMRITLGLSTMYCQVHGLGSKVKEKNTYQYLLQ